MDKTYLAHHGILGMKWGERRFQNEDGSLTPAGKERYKKVASSEKLYNKDMKAAYRMAKREAQNYEIIGTTKQGKGDRYEKKAAKGEYITEQEREKQKKYYVEARAAFAKSEQMKKLMKDLDSGSFKAGRDFIVQSDWYHYPLYIPGVGSLYAVRNKKRIIVNPDRG